MNRYQKAYKVILRIYEDVGFKDTMWFRINLNIIKELVNKSTPMKPINTHYNTHGNLLWGDCPICKNKTIAFRNCNMPECSQALDWSKDE